MEHGPELGVDASRLALIGDSVGGNMVAAVTLLAKERGGPKIDLQVLCYPVTDGRFATESYTRFAEGPWLSKREMQWFWDAYLLEVQGREAITASPLRASIEQLRGLPDALVMVDENDVLRDEREAYAPKLSQAGVRVTTVRYNGTIHDFMVETRPGRPKSSAGAAVIVRRSAMVQVATAQHIPRFITTVNSIHNVAKQSGRNDTIQPHPICVGNTRVCLTGCPALQIAQKDRTSTFGQVGWLRQRRCEHALVCEFRLLSGRTQLATPRPIA